MPTKKQVKARAIEKIGSIITNKPKMASQVSSTSLEQVRTNVSTKTPGKLAANRELQSRATNDVYGDNNATRRKKGFR